MMTLLRGIMSLFLFFCIAFAAFVLIAPDQETGFAGLARILYAAVIAAAWIGCITWAITDPRKGGNITES